MPRARAKFESKPSDDIGWNFATSTGNKGEMICSFCGKKVIGGITRLKQHLAHISSQVTSCPKVSDTVRKDMYRLMIDFNLAKKQKAKRSKELEDECARMNEPDFEDDGEDDDFKQARQKSMRQYHEDEYRRSIGDQYDVGGGSGSGQQQKKGFGRSFTVRERIGGSLRFTPASTPSTRLTDREIELEKERAPVKQQKIKTKWFKNQKEKLMEAFGNFVIHNRLPFAVVNSPWTRPLLRAACEIGPNIPPPTPYEIGKSVDASLVTSKDAEYYFGLMKSVVQEIGPEKVVQIVTDNEAAMKPGGKKLMEAFPHIYWTGCAAHCIDLILEDFGKRKTIKDVMEIAKKITQSIYNHNWVCNYMKKITDGRDILRPGITRYAINFIALESIMRHKIGLRNMFESEEWLASKYGKATTGPAVEVKKIILSLSSKVIGFGKKQKKL
ncbi:uncharacterized protein LOC126687544 [Mercurialis annua]|uniref:uncharacterized protein LOC126687544 n=1 Tax=Mercurialis annua TaxID=3986 RepID=UPI002160EB6C|nr:uncharacterized protein LOC126687544 [Mercurialis annua]